jgi:hypothetical protein
MAGKVGRGVRADQQLLSEPMKLMVVEKPEETMCLRDRCDVWRSLRRARCDLFHAYRGVLLLDCNTNQLLGQQQLHMISYNQWR